jgi:putative membrane protein
LFRGLGLEASVDRTADALRNLLYAGRVTLITYVVALALIVVGGVQGTETVAAVRGVTDGALPLGTAVTAFVHGFVQWLGVAGVTSSLGQITDEYLAGRFRWRYLNAPFYVVAIAVVSYGVTGFVLPSAPSVTSLTLADLALVLAGGTLLGVLSTLTFAIAESQLPSGDPT